MSDRVSWIVLLCEDEEHCRLALGYMQRCGIKTDRVVDQQVASRKQHGGNDAWVLREFARQLNACRRRAARARTLLVVLIDADHNTLDERRRQLNSQLQPSEQIVPSDPMAVLIPRRHVETWFCALRNISVTEEEDCKPQCRNLTKQQFRHAAEMLYQWARPNAEPGGTCVPSLLVALPEWRRID